MRALLLVLAIGVLGDSVLGQCGPVIGGRVGPTVRTITRGCYVVNSSIVVPQGSKLIIHPGVVLKFQNNQGLTVQGQLLAEGTSDEPIKMEPFTPNVPEQGRRRRSWTGVTFSSVRAGRPSPHVSTLKHVEIHSPLHGLKITDHRVDIEHVTVNNSYNIGIGFTISPTNREPIKISDVTVLGSMGNCINIQSRSGTPISSMVNITGCRLRGRTGATVNGIYIYRGHSNVRTRPRSDTIISGCTFENIGREAISENQAGTTVISGCNFTRVYSAISTSSRNVELKGNRVLFSGRIYSSNLVNLRQSDNVKVLDNIFENNINFYRGFRRDALLISISLDNAIQTNRRTPSLLPIVHNQNIQILRNQFRNNVNYTIIHLSRQCSANQDVMNRLRRSPYDQVCHCTGCIIRDNTFQNNEVNKTGSAVINLSNMMQEITISRNCFYDTDKPGCSIRCPFRNARNVGEVDATRNYWATTDIHKIYARVCSFYTETSFSFVNVIPFYVDCSKTQEMSPGYIVNGNQIGGDLTGRISLSPQSAGAACFYKMLHSTYIREGAVLIIAAGCTIEFGKNVGIEVHGDLIFLGTNNRPVTLRYCSVGVAGGKWAGIRYPNKPGRPLAINLEHIIFEDVDRAIVLMQGRPPTHIRVIAQSVDVRLNNIQVTNSGSVLEGINGIYASKATYKIRNSKFSNSRRAIFLQNNNHMIETLIENCVFDRNNVSILATTYNASKIVITNSIFSNGHPSHASIRDCQLDLTMTNSTISISNNTFSRNNKHIICLEVSKPSGVCDINYNVFSNNKNSAGILLSFRSLRDFEIKGNKFMENNNTRGTACIVMNPSLAPTRNSLNISHNHFDRNQGRQIVNLVNHHWPTIEPHVKVHTNAFDNNFASRATINAAIVSSSITGNNFQNPNTRIDVRTGITRSPSGSEINCTNNYWGTNDVTEIEGKIWDRNDARGRNRAKFQPYRNAPNSVS